MVKLTIVAELGPLPRGVGCFYNCFFSFLTIKTVVISIYFFNITKNVLFNFFSKIKFLYDPFLTTNITEFSGKNKIKINRHEKIPFDGPQFNELIVRSFYPF